MKAQLIITHPGSAHFDDVAAISLILAVYPDTEFSMNAASQYRRPGRSGYLGGRYRR